MFLEKLRTGGIARTGAVLVAGIFILTACVPAGNIRQEYASDTSDPCNSHRQTLVETKESFSKTIAQAAMAGAVAGALIGFLTEGDLQGALTGAAIGGLAGAAAGYFKAKHDKAKTRRELLTAIQGDFAVDNQRLDKAGQAVRGMTQCRRNQYQAILSDFNAGTIDRDTALTRKEGISASIEQDRQLISLLLEGAEKRAEDYTAALNNGFELPPGALMKGISPQQQALLMQSSYPRYIALQSANVRPGPSNSGTPVGGLAKGELVHVLAGNESQQWKPITRPDEQIAYVFGALIAPEGSPQAQKVLAEIGGKAKMPTTDEQEAHDAARENLNGGVAEMVAMQQEMEAEFSFLKESTTELFHDDIMMVLALP
uniref:Glycine zipper n=1 Tax=Candidatus Kentrum sp. DK TaxID=2126562 RepID=A0A450RVU8_9GAMM|nr:MAG: Glycine zipper [Candidatus Kentron sp. DK]